MNKRFNGVIQYIRKIAGKLLRWIFLHLPINKKKIVLQNFGGRGYGCNPKYIAEEILRRELDVDLVWLCKDMNEKFPTAIRKVKYDSWKARYELVTAKVWIDNVRNGMRMPKRKGQYYIQTWHGGLALKKVEKAVEEYLEPKYVERVKLDSEITDLMLSDSEWTTKNIRNNFWYSGEIVETGIPKKDILYAKPSEVIDSVKEQYGVSGKKIVLYAPTFRNNGALDVYKFNYEKCLNLFEKKFDQECVFFMRLHPNITELSAELTTSQRVINVSHFPDMQELLVTADVLITDYSSVMFEFACMKKPVFLYMPDQEEYIKNERGLWFDLNKLPFNNSTTDVELFEQISAFDEKLYNGGLEEFEKNIGEFPTTKASSAVVDIICKKIS